MGTIVIEEVFLDACWKSLEHIKDVKRFHVPVLRTMSEDHLSLHLRLHSSTNKGLLSAQLLELGSKKYLQPYPAVLSVRTLDNGRYHMLDNLTELPFKEAGQRVISKGYLNLQNRHDLLEVEAVTPGEWMEFDFDLQPTIYKLEKGATLRLVLYTTDFEITVRDQTDYQLTIDLAQSSLHLPEMTETR